MYTYITEENHEFKKAKGINKNFVDDELKYEDYKNVSFNRSYMAYEFKTKIKMYEPTELIKLICLVTMMKNINLMDIVGYHIFINLLANYIKIYSPNIDHLF